jgi:PAS domain S-box-containing protein
VGHNPHELLKTIHGVPFTEIEAKLRKDGNWEGELRHFTKDGRELVVSARHQLIVGSDGVERILETNRDITERKRSESVLRASEARLRLAHIAANAGTWEWDLRTNTNFWSDEAWKVYGLVPGSCEPSYEAWLQLIHPDDLARVEQAVRDAVREGKELIVEWRLRDADGAERWLMSRGQPVRDTDGVVASYIGIVLDISERKRSEEALLRSEKLASLGRMASTISHEINNPLETIGHALYLALTDSGTSETARSYLELAVQELDRVTHITRQTLAFHRDSNAPKLIDLRESVDSIVKLFASRLKSREITIEQRYPEVERINAFSSEIQQVISNLLSNSMDAVPRRGRIHLRLSRSLGKNGDRRVRFTIADNGSGIPLDRQKKIFEPFFTTKEVVGTGLGLWVTKQIVDKHKATIRVRSKLGRGTVFSITFPTGEANMQAL